MKALDTAFNNWHLPSFLLFLSEHIQHMARGLKSDFSYQNARMSDGILPSTLRYTSRHN